MPTTQPQKPQTHIEYDEAEMFSRPVSPAILEAKLLEVYKQLRHEISLRKAAETVAVDLQKQLQSEAAKNEILQKRIADCESSGKISVDRMAELESLILDLRRGLSHVNMILKSVPF